MSNLGARTAELRAAVTEVFGRAPHTVQRARLNVEDGSRWHYGWAVIVAKAIAFHIVYLPPNSWMVRCTGRNGSASLTIWQQQGALREVLGAARAKLLADRVDVALDHTRQDR